MHELVDLGHSMTHAAVGLCQDETRTSEHIGISPAEEGWTVANDNERYLVAALTCNVLQHIHTLKRQAPWLEESGGYDYVWQASAVTCWNALPCGWLHCVPAFQGWKHSRRLTTCASKSAT
jgi:hypothetical protein